MKKLNIIFVTTLLHFTTVAQFHEDTTLVESPLIEMAQRNSGVWDFSSFSVSEYPNTTDRDLLHRVQPSAELASGLVPTFATNNPMIVFEEDGHFRTLFGDCNATRESQGTIILPGDTIEGVVKYKWIETYEMKLDGNLVATYTNEYYCFVEESSLIVVYEAFKKHRALRTASSNQFYYGIGTCSSCGADTKPYNIKLRISPNPSPAKGYATIAYELQEAGVALISITDQSGAVNNTLYEGETNPGVNSLKFLVIHYLPGTYTIHLTINGIDYSEQLIIN